MCASAMEGALPKRFHQLSQRISSPITRVFNKPANFVDVKTRQHILLREITQGFIDFDIALMSVKIILMGNIDLIYRFKARVYRVEL